MMNITVFSFTVAILWCNVYILIITLMRKHNRFLMHFSYFPLIVLIFAGVFRMICPIEFPYTAVLPSKIIFPALFHFLITPLDIFSKDMLISIFDIFIFIWMFGSIYLLLKYIHQLFRFHQTMIDASVTSSIQILSCLDEIKKKKCITAKVKIIQSVDITVPMVTGFFQPTIYLPEVTFSDEEINIILQHELTHFLHKDAWNKMLMYLLVVLFWWNPFIHLLKRDLNHILEIKCDLSLASRMNEEDKIHYLETMMNVVRFSKKMKLQSMPIDAIGLMEANRQTKLEQRFHLILGYEAKKWQRTVLNLLLCGFIVSSMAFSYLFVIQPEFSVENVTDEATFSITQENSYLVLNGDSTYALYVEGEYRGLIKELNGQPFLSLPIKNNDDAKGEKG